MASRQHGSLRAGRVTVWKDVLSSSFVRSVAHAPREDQTDISEAEFLQLEMSILQREAGRLALRPRYHAVARCLHGLYEGLIELDGPDELEFGGRNSVQNSGTQGSRQS